MLCSESRDDVRDNAQYGLACTRGPNRAILSIPEMHNMTSITPEERADYSPSSVPRDDSTSPTVIRRMSID